MIKNILFLLLAGMIPLLGTALFMQFVNLNLSYIVLLGTGLLFIMGVWQYPNPIALLLKIIVISAPLCTGYYILVVQELPGLWIALPLFVASVVAGLCSRKIRTAVYYGSGVTAAGLLVSFMLVPEIISDRLTEKVHSPAPSFVLENVLTSEKVTNNDLLDRVIVLDFFGTHCAPCIVEMEELKRIKEKLSGHESGLSFMVVCNDTGGDTPEKAKKFYTDRKLPFSLLYDDEAVAHKKFGFTGVPGLVILDKEGNIRLKHEGYNAAEDLQATLLPVIYDLLAE